MQRIINTSLLIALPALLFACDADTPHPSTRAPSAAQPRDTTAALQLKPETANQPAVHSNEPSTNAATAEKGAQPEAVAKISAARCQREAKCSNVGTGKDYATLEACVSQIQEEWVDDLNAFECPGGVVMKELEECLAEIESEECGHPLDTLSRIVACRSSDICKALE